MRITFHKQRGVNMIEVLVTLVITAIGLLGLNSLQLKATRATSDTGNRSQAVWLLEDLGNRIRANSIAINDYSTGAEPEFLDPEIDPNTGESTEVANPNAGKIKPFVCPSTPSKICRAYHNGSARQTAATDCSTAEQAQFDLWEVACPLTGNNKIRINNMDFSYTRAIDFITNPELFVAVDPDTNAVTMMLAWDVRTSGLDSNGNRIYDSESSAIADRRDTLTTVIQP